MATDNLNQTARYTIDVPIAKAEENITIISNLITQFSKIHDKASTDAKSKALIHRDTGSEKSLADMLISIGQLNQALKNKVYKIDPTYCILQTQMFCTKEDF